MTVSEPAGADQLVDPPSEAGLRLGQNSRHAAPLARREAPHVVKTHGQSLRRADHS